MISRTTNGAGSTTAETTTNKINYASKDFDPSTQEYVQFALANYKEAASDLHATLTKLE